MRVCVCELVCVCSCVRVCVRVIHTHSSCENDTHLYLFLDVRAFFFSFTGHYGAAHCLVISVCDFFSLLVFLFCFSCVYPCSTFIKVSWMIYVFVHVETKIFSCVCVCVCVCV